VENCSDGFVAPLLFWWLRSGNVWSECVTRDVLNALYQGRERGKVVIGNIGRLGACPTARKCPPSTLSIGAITVRVSKSRHKTDSKCARSYVTRVMQSLSYPVAMLDDVEANGFDAPDGTPTRVAGRK
jgi:hypothetical protein